MKIITWDTYTIRKEIKAKFNAFWNADHKGRACPKEDGLHEFCGLHNLEIIELDEPVEQESDIDKRIRYVKKRLEKWSNVEAKNESIVEASYEKSKLLTNNYDNAILTEPIKIWHHSEKRHRKLKETIWKNLEKRHEAYEKIDEAQDKKEYREAELKLLESKKAGTRKNAEQRRTEESERVKNSLKVWDKVIYNRTECTIEKMNAKTCKLKEYWFNVLYHYLGV